VAAAINCDAKIRASPDDISRQLSPRHIRTAARCRFAVADAAFVLVRALNTPRLRTSIDGPKRVAIRSAWAANIGASIADDNEFVLVGEPGKKPISEIDECAGMMAF
jgi:hypothetical protein